MGAATSTAATSALAAVAGRSARRAAVALLSAGTMAYEILLVRVFAIEQFHHLAYMAIGVAMLGFGASGTLVALAGARGAEVARGFTPAAALTAALLAVTPALVDRVPLDLTQLGWNPDQWPRLAVLYLLLALPFALGALAVLLALRAERDRPGPTYGASFLGSGLGAALAVGVLWVAAPARALALPALLAALGAVAAALGARGPLTRRLGVSLAVAAATVVLAAVVTARPFWRLDVSPYKGLPQVEAFPGARRVAERTSPLGWVVAVDAPAFRHAPGLSMAYAGAFPRQTALFVDGQIAGAASRSGRDSSAVAMFRWLPTALPFALGTSQRVLVVGAGGGTDVLSARLHGAGRVVAVELNPDLIRLGEAFGSDPGGDEGGASAVEWIARDARSYVARSRERFDVITLGLEGAFGGAGAGVHSLSEDFLHTVDAYADYLARLGDGGVLAVTRWLTVPPRSSVRVTLTAAEALRRAGYSGEAIARALIVMRSWGTTTLLVKPSGFAPPEVATVRRWAAERQFDLDWYPGVEAPTAEFNVLEEPALYEAAAAAVAGADSSARFARAYPFDVAPVDDARPYPNHFLRAGSFAALMQGGTGSWLPFAEWGYIALVATLVQSAILAALLMLVPVAVRSRAARADGGRLPAVIGYFGAIGLGYMAAEIAVIQQLGLLLGHPVYAVAAALTAFLIFSGVGSAWSDRLRGERAWRVAAALVALLVLSAAVLLAVVHTVHAAPIAVRAVVAFLALAPLAFLMGVPFPTGIRTVVAGDATHVAWAWAANGFASVVAAPLAALIALEAGSPALLLVAAGAYAVAALLQASRRRPESLAQAGARP